MPVSPAPAPLCHNALCSVLTLATSRCALLAQSFQVADVTNAEMIFTYSFKRIMFFFLLVSPSFYSFSSNMTDDIFLPLS